MNANNLIVCIGRNQRNQELLSQVLVKAGYAVKVMSLEEVMAAISLPSISLPSTEQPSAEQLPIGLVLLDISGFDTSIWQACEKLRSQAISYFLIAPHNIRAYKSVPQYAESRLLTKPLDIRQLLTLIAHVLPRPDAATC
ncbi:MAG: hypothetical protein AAGN15_09160 [Cyanobacteria bacterium J06581_3]